MIQNIFTTVCHAVFASLLLTCTPGAPREPVDKSFFIGTWHGDTKCLENIRFSETHAEWQINYRTCLSDTIQNPYQLVDSVTYDTVRDSFLIMDYKGWQASDSEIVFLDTFRLPTGSIVASRTACPISIASDFQFYIRNAAADTAAVLYTKQ
jgi:hypothetical protein